MRQPLISIIMPVFNASSTLAEAVRSIICQSHQEWELLIIDDCSTDDPAAIIGAMPDQRIRLFRLQQNLGVANALNVGIAAARARYIARMDADDLMADWRLGEQLRYVVADRLVLCGTGAQKFGDEHGTIRNASEGWEIVDAFLTGNPFLHPTIMFDRALLGEKLRYDAAFRCEEDYALWARLVTPGNCGNMPGLALRYRVRKEGNANHPTKSLHNRAALTLFAERWKISRVLPIDALSEFQMSGFVSAPDYRRLGDYARLAERESLPRLGVLQKALAECRNYAEFVEWLLRHHEIQRQASFGPTFATPPVHVQ